ncbi:DUF481 domain-containing protein [Histidinibacterium aquaticum]|uniref:DUF481 domain-containing protein n=1 Tax=Histidinibacterium aquaticum TaxID=2613962 RepID=A0A5J5GF06_9RHOB|nr:DUF481 domain-containing protein [Histidinibacterium aquaticum]KAA9006054.1 DUF481 domain-containing protein [Histidinibacterium aquaticum]
MKLVHAAPLAALLAGAAGMAQAQDTVFTGTDQVEDANEALAEDIEEDFERDRLVGNEGRELGFSGSLALRGSASTGNSDSVDIGLGANYGYFDGTNGYELQLNYRYGEEDGTRTEESLLYDLEYTRDFNPRLYGFAKVQGSIDEFSSYETDTFIGAGLGYRIYNTPDIQWSVQAGPGYRVAELTDIDESDFEEGALSVASNYSNRISPDIVLTNDTDIIASESDTVVYNDFGVNFSVADSLALRTSVATEYHTDPVPGREDTDNTYGVSLIYDFN